MPYVVMGNRSPRKITSYPSKDLGYKYPEGLNLRPGTELHDDIVNRIYDRATYSYSKMSDRFSSWEDIDATLTAYKYVDDDEKKLQEIDSRKPVSIVFPFSYAIMETLLTYVFKALTPSPIFKYEGTGPEDTLGAILLEMLIDYHCKKNKVALNIHTLIRDALAYGVAGVSPVWVQKVGRKRIQQPGEVYDVEGGLSYATAVDVVEDAVLFEGNGLENISPYKLLLDPDVASTEVQSMNFVGWNRDSSYESLLQTEAYGKGLFNVKYLKEAQLYTDIFSDRPIVGGDNRYGNMTTVISMYVTLIPSEWKLGNGELPEKWLFQVANGDILIEATKLDFDHGMYPIAVASPDFDGYTSCPMSRLEIVYGMQHMMDWLLNSHITNVRKAVNDMFIIDPFMIDYDDVANPQPGKLIKLRRPQWGKGVEGAIKQFPVNDITRANVGDLSLLMNSVSRIAASDDAVSGFLRQGGPDRLTAAEFEGTRAGAGNRLERVASVIALQAFQDIGYMFASHAQQMLTTDFRLRILGEWQDRLSKVMMPNKNQGTGFVSGNVTDLAVDYDLIVKDGTVPGGNFNSGWLKVFDMLLKAPQQLGEYDLNRIFEFIAMNLGARNVADFKKYAGANAQFMPDGQVAKEAAAGNLMPIGGM